MILSNVNIGSGPSTGDGDPLRTAFDLINHNFTAVSANVNRLSNSVTSVAGRTGNVTLIVNDVIGAASRAYVDYAIAQIPGGEANSASYVTLTTSHLVGYDDGPIDISTGQSPGYSSPLVDTLRTGSLPSFITYVEGRGVLGNLDVNFGWNTQGVWFSGNANDPAPQPSYPIFTNFTISSNYKTVVEFEFAYNNYGADHSVCFYRDGVTPRFTWSSSGNNTRIAGQWNQGDAEINGLGGIAGAGSGIELVEGTSYKARFTYDPMGDTKVTLETLDLEYTVLDTVTSGDVLSAGDYRIGWAADQDSNGVRSYISNVVITTDGIVGHPKLTLATDGAITLPGATILAKTSALAGNNSDNGGLGLALDLTKQVQYLDSTNGTPYYYLADGQEGQIMHFVAKEGINQHNIAVNCAHIRYRNNSTITAPGDWLPFWDGIAPNGRTMGTGIFIGGAWSFDGGDID